MLQIKILHPGIFMLVLFSVSLAAQEPEQTTVQDLYENALYPSDELLNGREYKYYFSQRRSPLIPKDPSQLSTVLIRNNLHQDVMLKYDTYKDLLIYFNPENSNNSMITPVIVNHNIIDEFTLQLPSGKARFRYLKFPEDQPGLLKKGYYEVVGEGTPMFIIKHGAHKRIQDGELVYFYKTERYIINSGITHKIKGKKSLLKALADHTTEVNQYMKRSNIDVRNGDRGQIKKVIEFYTSLE